MSETQTILNQDGSYMSPDEIFNNLTVTIIDGPTQRAFASGFTPHPEADLNERMAVTYGRSMIGMQIRNSFGMWHRANPQFHIDPEPSDQGVVDDPLFPDNACGAIIERVSAHFKAIYPDCEYADRMEMNIDG